MEFYTIAGQKRPVRSKESTRRFAYDSLNHVYGLDTAKTPAVSMDDIEGFAAMEPIDQYDLAIRRIAERAPIRICPDELLSGAATLGKSINHRVPFSCDGMEDMVSISHLTVDFETVLTRGVNAIEQDVHDSLKRHTEPRRVRFLQSCLSAIESMRIWHKRYLDALQNKPGYERNYQNLLRVPFETPRNFYEAVQSLWFTFAFIRLCGNWPGFGRLDYLLGDYLKHDLADKTLTLDEAREILAHFFIKGCEWVKGGDYGSGDAQHYQNIVLSGIDENQNDITNEVTYLVLDIIEEFGISDFPTTIRLNKHTDPKLYQRAAEVLRYGGGILAFYDEDTVLEGFKRYGYPEERWKFANDGCWEVQIPGKTYFCYLPFDILQTLQRRTLNSYVDGTRYDDFESLYEQFRLDLAERVQDCFDFKFSVFDTDLSKDGNWVWKPTTPCTVVSLFEQGCVEKGLSYLEGGPVYHVASPHIGGLPDVVNSLYAIKKAVFDEKMLSFDELMAALRDNWDGNEVLRQRIKNAYHYYGNDNDECDAIATRILTDFSAICRTYEGKSGYRFYPGISTFGRQLGWAPYRLATADGHKAHEVLSGNFSPTPGTDTEGATAIIRSCCKADLADMGTGAALDMRLHSSAVVGDDGISALTALLQGFVELGGCFIQFDVADKEVLKKAQEHPEDYQTLSVRVSGWNARFVTLNKEWQDMLINENR